MRPRARLALLALLAVLPGCGPSPAAAPAVEVRDPWARPSPAGVTVGAAYLTLESATADSLTGVAAPATLCERAEMHAIVKDAAGQLGMEHVEAVALPARRRVEFRPGSHHVMLIGLVRPLVAGDTLELSLRFAHAGARVVRVPVRQD